MRDMGHTKIRGSSWYEVPQTEEPAGAQSGRMTDGEGPCEQGRSLGFYSKPFEGYKKNYTRYIFESSLQCWVGNELWGTRETK